MNISNTIIEKLNAMINNQRILGSYILQKQHALYPHLVPMHRTVHRKKPRNIVFRAIRWVNPRRYFPNMRIPEEDIGRMNEAQIKRFIREIHEYRQDAQEIHNKYRMMRLNIQQGKTPYPILWPEKKWLTLDERMDRCMDLTKGTITWENEIDKKAALARQVMRKNFGQSLDDIPELWGDGDRHPVFRDPKKGRDQEGNYRRYLRTTKDRERMRGGAETGAQRMRAVAPEEIREGEKVMRYRPTPEEVAERKRGIGIRGLEDYITRGPIATEDQTQHLPHAMKVYRQQRIGLLSRAAAEAQEREDQLIINTKQAGPGSEVEYDASLTEPLVPLMGKRIWWASATSAEQIDLKEATEEDKRIQEQYAGVFNVRMGQGGQYFVKPDADGEEQLYHSPTNGLTARQWHGDSDEYHATRRGLEVQDMLNISVMAPTEVVDVGQDYEEQGYKSRYVTFEDTLKGKSMLSMSPEERQEVMQDPKVQESLLMIGLFDFLTGRENKRRRGNMMYSGGRFWATNNHTQFNRNNSDEMFSTDTNFPETDPWPEGDYTEVINNTIEKFFTEHMPQDIMRQMMKPRPQGGLGLTPPRDGLSIDRIRNYLDNMTKGSQDISAGRISINRNNEERLLTASLGEDYARQYIDDKYGSEYGGEQVPQIAAPEQETTPTPLEEPTDADLADIDEGPSEADLAEIEEGDIGQEEQELQDLIEEQRREQARQSRYTGDINEE